MGHYQRDPLQGDLPVVGYVPFRPLGQSHFEPAPWQVSDDTAYIPAVLTEEALRKGVQKAREPLAPQIEEDRYDRVYEYMNMRLSKLWAGDNIMSYEEAVSRLNLDKSPGYPFYYECDDKGCALTCHGHEIKEAVMNVLAGKEMWLPSTLTLKDELRLAEKVKEGKTRVFSASNLVNLIASKMLFDKQNDKLRKHLDEHPLTIGIQVPGPHFVKRVLSLSRECNCIASDIAGCDQRFPLWAARLIRDNRKIGIPPEYHAAVDLLYDEDFAGDVICCGVCYKMFHNKSGRNNTGDDTGLMEWTMTAEYVLTETKCSVADVDNFWEGMFNGDDGMTAWWGDLTGVGWRNHLAQFNVILELEKDEFDYSENLVFLSHHLKLRNIPDIGDVIVAAGNREKLVSSIQWLRRNSDFTVEENALAHLLGLRIALWPWRADFLDVEELIDRFVDSIEITPSISNVLKARISERQIINLHLRFEDGFDFFPDSDTVEGRVRDLIISSILESVDNMSNNKAKELARRMAQSKKDKAMAKKGQSKGKSEVNTGVKKETHTKAPLAMATDSKAAFAKKHGGRFKDMITISGSDHLEFVIQPSGGSGVGQVLNEIYISPSEFGGTRLEKYSQLYEKYRFTKLDFEYVPSASATDRGDIILSYDRDISDPTPPANEQGLRQFTSYEGAVDGNIWTPKTCRNRITAPEAGYYTNTASSGGDDRLAYQGQFYVAVVAPLSVSAGTTIGRIRLHYVCEFFTPQLESSQNQAIVQFDQSVPPGAGSNNDFNAFTGGGLPSALTGWSRWLPVVDALGKYYFKLDPGVYKIIKSIVTDAAGGWVFTSTNGQVNIDPSTVVPVENMPASAPQPWVEVVGGGSCQGIAASDPVSTAFISEVVGIPRGGANIYETFDNTAITDVSGGARFALDIQKLSNYVPSYSEFFTARYEGAECRDPKQFKSVAVARAKRRGVVMTGKSFAPTNQKTSKKEAAAIPSPALRRAVLAEEGPTFKSFLEEAQKQGVSPADMLKKLMGRTPREVKTDEADRKLQLDLDGDECNHPKGSVCANCC